MNRPEYREAWDWVHLMLRSRPEARKVLLAYLQQLRTLRHPFSGEPTYPPLRTELKTVFRFPEDELRRHLNRLESAVRTAQHAGR
jgi:hypothetical protein